MKDIEVNCGSYTCFFCEPWTLVGGGGNLKIKEEYGGLLCDDQGYPNGRSVSQYLVGADEITLRHPEYGEITGIRSFTFDNQEPKRVWDKSLDGLSDLYIGE